MSSTYNAFPIVIARFMLACPFLISSATTFTLLKDETTAGSVTQQIQSLFSALGEIGVKVPQDKLAILLAVTQGMGGFLVVFNHKFGGMLLMLYLLPVTLLTHQFWKEEYDSLEAQQDVLRTFLQNVAIMGGVLLFMATTDGVPLKVKRKPHEN